MLAALFTALLAAGLEEHHGGPAPRLAELAGISGISDAELAARLRAGDEAAFSQLYRVYYPRLVAVARGFVDLAVAEELAQDVLAHVWARHTEWTITDGIGVYLYAAVRNRARKQLRHAGVVERVERASAALGEAPGMAAQTEAATDRLEHADIRAAVDAALATLSEGARTAFTLRWMHELSYEEIARIMETSEATVRQQVSKARRAVVPVLERYVRG